MAGATHTVVKNDTVWSISVKYGVSVDTIMKLNNLVYTKNSDGERIVLIYPGQVLKLSGTASKIEENTVGKPVVRSFGLQADSDNLLFAIWTWDKKNTEKYQLRWKYQTSDGVWFYGNNSSISVDENDPNASKVSTYSIPNNAVAVSFEVLPVAKKKQSNSSGTDTAYWTADWSDKKVYSCAANVIPTPGAPSVEVVKYKLTTSMDNIPTDVKTVTFQIIKDNKDVVSTAKATVTQGYASHTYTIAAGSVYKVRCTYGGGWSPYSNNVSTIPAAPSAITVCRANSKSTDNRISVYLEWPSITSATSYEIEYTTNKDAFGSSDGTSKMTGIETNYYETYSLDPGYEYFFRVRAVNNSGNSDWSAITSVVLGKTPTAPTTWSSVTSAVVGEPLNLYWVHNSEDGSSQTWAQIEIYVNDILDVFEEIKNSTDIDERDKTSVYSIDTSEYEEGAVIKWRVRTAGVTNELGEWSIQRTVTVYAPPTLDLTLTNSSGEWAETLTSYPLRISALAGPNTQKPIGYYLVITANEFYETVDNLGNIKMVNKGESVYSKYFDISEQLSVELSAGDVDFKNNESYTVTCTAAMDSGLTGVATPAEFTVTWSQDIPYEPNAEIGIDPNSYVAFIRPYCEDNEGNPVENITLSVYRREYDGSFVEIATDIDNTSNTFITDPHPALDYARYRIVAMSTDTGAIRYYDMPGHSVGGKAAILQWDETWMKSFDAANEDIMVEPTWSGSMLKLPYNIDISDKHQTDAALVEYIGRKYPVTYYGTQLGETSTWSVAIPKSDTETLYALRRLAIWMGDVYVREPSGSGYWANITVSFSQKHLDVTIPVTIEVTRVEGGV